MLDYSKQESGYGTGELLDRLQNLRQGCYLVLLLLPFGLPLGFLFRIQINHLTELSLHAEKLLQLHLVVQGSLQFAHLECVVLQIPYTPTNRRLQLVVEKFSSAENYANSHRGQNKRGAEILRLAPPIVALRISNSKTTMISDIYSERE